MTLQTIVEQPVQHRSFRLTRPGAAPAAVATQVRPSIVLPDREARALLAGADRADITRDGCFSAGPAGVQVWSGPWNGLLGTRGSAEHLGSVDWSYDTPSRHYITIYRVLVTARGTAARLSAEDVLGQVLALAGVEIPGQTAQLVVPPPRDPFRAARQRDAITLPE